MNGRVPHIAVDLDGTLAQYDGWKGIAHIGEPIPSMMARVKAALAMGWEVTIFTARASHRLDGDRAASHVVAWCYKHFGRTLQVTSTKHVYFDEIWDDRAVRVDHNCGTTSHAGEHWRKIDDAIHESVGAES